MLIQCNGYSYNLENELVKKLDIMIERITRETPVLDAWLQVEGSEGSGKSNSAVAMANYVKQKTGRDAHIFFRLQALINHAQRTKKQIMIWDEPSLDSLSTDQLKRIGRDLLRLAMTIRKRQHMFIINFTKFWKFGEYIVVDRCLGMVHMYSKDEIDMGRFVYIKKKSLETLWNDYMKAKIRSYKKCTAFRGHFPEVMDKYFDLMDFSVEGKPHATMKDYHHQKDLAINSIGKVDEVKGKKESKMEQDFNNFKSAFGKLRHNIKDLKIECAEDWAKALGVSVRTVERWSKIDKKPEIEENSLGNEGFEGSADTINITTMVEGQQIDDCGPEEEEEGL